MHFVYRLVLLSTKDDDERRGLSCCKTHVLLSKLHHVKSPLEVHREEGGELLSDMGGEKRRNNNNFPTRVMEERKRRRLSLQ